MTPEKFLYYSLIGMGDAVVLVILVSALVGSCKGMVESLIRTYFHEYEQMMHRMAKGNSVPPVMSEFMH